MRLIIIALLAQLASFSAESQPEVRLPTFSSAETPLFHGLTFQCFNIYYDQNQHVVIGNLKWGVKVLEKLPADTASAKIDWRLANGQVFAAIVPVSQLTANQQGAIIPKNMLYLCGISCGHASSDIDTLIDADFPGARAFARQIVDSSYRYIRGKWDKK